MKFTSHKNKEPVFHRTPATYGKVQDFLSEFVYGGIDGSITTFAVVAGAHGANLDSSIVIILGFANLFADGLSMSIGAYLSAKSEIDNYIKHKNVEYWEVETMPEIERKEVEEIYMAKGFNGELLEKIVDTITSDKDRWVEEMMKNELEMIPSSKSPFFQGLATFLSFLIIGFIPLSVYVYYWARDSSQHHAFIYTCILTGLAFILIGVLKAFVNQTSKLKGVLETVLLGGIAATVAYSVGHFLEQLMG